MDDDPLRGYGRPTSYWVGRISRFFPADDPLSPAVVAFLVRMDELRFFIGRIYEQGHTEEASPRSSTDLRLENIIAFRYSVIAISDADKALDAINRDSRFREVLQTKPEHWDEFVRRRRVVKSTYEQWDFIRDNLAAHIDLDTVAETLKKQGDAGLGGVWLGRKNMDFAFDIAHVVLACALHKDVEEGDDTREERDAKMRQMTADAAAATNELLSLYPMVIWGFHQLTGRFFPMKG